MYGFLIATVPEKNPVAVVIRPECLAHDSKAFVKEYQSVVFA